jgi:hypothetical protein
MQFADIFDKALPSGTAKQTCNFAPPPPATSELLQHVVPERTTSFVFLNFQAKFFYQFGPDPTNQIIFFVIRL